MICTRWEGTMGREKVDNERYAGERTVCFTLRFPPWWPASGWHNEYVYTSKTRPGDAKSLGSRYPNLSIRCLRDGDPVPPRNSPTTASRNPDLQTALRQMESLLFRQYGGWDRMGSLWHWMDKRDLILAGILVWDFLEVLTPSLFCCTCVMKMVIPISGTTQTTWLIRYA